MPQVTGPLTTTAVSDVFGTHDAYFGIDGLRSVVDKSERNAIPAERRREGMMAYTQDDNKYWALKESPWLYGDDDWRLLEFGAGVPVSSQQFDFPTPSSDWVMDHNLGGRPVATVYDLDWNEIESDVTAPTTSRVVVHHDLPGGQAGHVILRNRG